mmetsp:Transcript_32640/g.97416  ORF Transcript_32640/g.97416 Transcript_32640/m.97416 type:complete len:299 (+) Transcript_32640:68-964(+)
MGRDSGLALGRNWALNRGEVLAAKQAGWPDWQGNQVFFDVVVGGRREQTMRLVFALFLDEVPLAAANFHALCTQRYEGLGDGGAPLTYRRSPISRVSRGGYLEGGSIAGNGAGGDSIFGASGFEDEPFGLRLRHNAPGLLSMVNHGPGTNRSAWRLTLAPCPSLDDTHVVFGRLVAGAAHLPLLEALPVDASGCPVSPVEVVDCGAMVGWTRPPLPSDTAEEAPPVSRESLRAQAAVQRSAVAEAVASALGKRAADAPAADTDAGGGKRAAVAAAMDPLLGLLGGSDDEEDEEKEGGE